MTACRKTAPLQQPPDTGTRTSARARGLAAIAALTLALVLGWCAPVGAAELPPGGLAPVLHVHAGRVEWAPVGVENSYDVAISTAPRGSAGRVTAYLTLARTPSELQSYLPFVPAGTRVWVGVSADGGLVWSAREVAVVGRAAAGEGPGGEAAEPGPVAGASQLGVPAVAPGGPATSASAPPAIALTGPLKRIIGTNDGAGWGSATAQTILSDHITWDRVEAGGSLQWAVQSSLADGFKLLGIVGNVPDGTPLGRVEPSAWGGQVAAQLHANPGISIAEAGNEMYLKGGVAEPVQYGRMYLAAVRAEHAAGIHVPLLFNMVGDYPRGSWSAPSGWSQDARGGGWLHDAVAAVPGLAAAIAENGISIHPYGAPGQNVRDTYGAAAPAADEGVARALLGIVPPFYITEFGYRLDACGTGWGACSTREQAERLRAAYAEFLADPHVAGIWWYQSHDDSTGRFGYISRRGRLRPAFGALGEIAVSQGQ